MFVKSARIDPTALIDFGVVVHSGSLVGENVHVGGSGVVCWPKRDSWSIDNDRVCSLAHLKRTVVLW
jgi:hypothetical protein